MHRGRFRKLFPERSKSLSENKSPRSLGIPSSDKLQSESPSTVKERSPETEGGNKLMGFNLFGDIHGKKSDNLDFDEHAVLPDNKTVLRFFKSPKEDGNCLMLVSSTRSSVKDIMFPNSSDNLSTFKQPDKLRLSRDLKL